MGNDIRKLNPSVNYDASLAEKNIDMMLRESRAKSEEKASLGFGKGGNNDGFYKYFMLIFTVIFAIILVNVTTSAFLMIEPEQLSPCRNVISDTVVDLYSNVDDPKTAESALVEIRPGEYSYIGSKVGLCGKYGMFSYYFAEGDTTFILCDDRTVTYMDTVCREQGALERLILPIITIIRVKG
ncbi:MAG: hypothetical protein KAI51_02405 [Candidatus Aenigmarchaeota archaeon]|nr:hypothetical protein [Candidatus Aenigmarchaeota archaeon]